MLKSKFKASKSAMTYGAAALALATSSSCFAQDVPFAQPGAVGQSAASLSDLMMSVLQRQSVLWPAGGSGNWSFASYEVGQMRARFVDAASNYRNIPVDVVVAMTKALDSVQTAIDRKDKARFETAFDSVTDACNSCHVAAGIAFIRIRRPTASGATNLNFLPLPPAPRSAR
jgi:cytochrome c556